MKKKYEPPQCIDLGGKSRTVTGDDEVNSCFSGSSAGGFQWCGTGSGAFGQNTCVSGGSPGFIGACASGTSPFACASGAGGCEDPTECQTGLSVL